MKWMPATEVGLAGGAALACGASYWNESEVSIPATGLSRSLLLPATGAVLPNQLWRGDQYDSGLVHDLEGLSCGASYWGFSISRI